ncbi:prepilin peptidase [Engelhardtia mirabilis]|uniref:Type 4 prepilin-like proteins leader peptide-processing enzyme n=1 Tax=Engelhardtia mirabilis TaxID=2528011 RepID=A0A518BP75_9BACT|nr:Type 4 prepilin-like proteins leader peptide-processing enzyme [Planctomycetes bacterium Pla133]QDV03109.1 Type 4 prepilin-like proteins leader peptide-processing enzyme [Planctomycetes bacterium Pla86]
MDVEPTFFTASAALFGAVVGSFLNVAIYRLPRPDLTVSKPARSQCPSCGHQIRWFENLPVASWVALRGKCSACGWRIPVRYPTVELLTAALFALAAWRFGPSQPGLTLVAAVVLAGLVVATFVDFDFFEIPDEVSIGGMVLGPLASLAFPALHAQTWLAQRFSDPALPLGEVDRIGALVGSLGGLAVGGGVLIAIGAFGKWLYGRDAMGFGDVKLLAAGGAFVGPGGALAALMVGSVLASVVGMVNLIRFTCFVRRRARARGGVRSLGRALAVGRIAARYLPFGPYLGIGIGIVLLAWDHVRVLWP